MDSSTSKICIYNYSNDELIKWLKSKNQPAFRAKQIMKWIYKGADFDEMHNLPKDLKLQLNDFFISHPAKIYQYYKSDIDDTVKLLYKFNDNNIVEGVLMKYHYGYSLCISTQVGCKMGCKFCASTLDGCIRNITDYEMLSEVICANKYLPDGEKVGHIVLMGSGEPLENYDNTISFLNLVHREDILNIGYRNISISTCGLVPEMEKFIDEKIPVTLSISLHAPNDEIRKQIMPIANTYSIKELIDTAKRYVKISGRRVIFEYALIDKLNSMPEHAIELSKILAGFQNHVNVIPLNNVSESSLPAPSEKTVKIFIDTLIQLGVSATRRREMGTDIAGACGQLRNSVIK